jgi:hypothetical protein
VKGVGRINRIVFGLGTKLAEIQAVMSFGKSSSFGFSSTEGAGGADVVPVLIPISYRRF